jgi:hypothetical protein
MYYPGPLEYDVLAKLQWIRNGSESHKFTRFLQPITVEIDEKQMVSTDLFNFSIFSQIFRIMFDTKHNMKECSQRIVKFAVSKELFECADQFVHFQPFEIEDHFALPLYLFADYLQIHQMQDFTWSYFERNILPFEPAKYLSDVYMLPNQRDDSIRGRKVIDRQLHKVIETEYWKKISFECLDEIIQRDTLALSETKIFASVISWIEGQEELSVKSVAKLFQNVRFGLIRDVPPQYMCRFDKILAKSPVDGYKVAMRFAICQSDEKPENALVTDLDYKKRKRKRKRKVCGVFMSRS